MFKSRTILVCATLSLASCHGDSGSTSIANADQPVNRPTPVKRGPTPDELTAGMVEAVTMGKSTVPVAVKFDLPSRPTAGQPVDVTIAVMPQIEADPATVMVTGSDALVLDPRSGPIQIPAVEPTQVYRHNVKLTPTAEGVQLLDLTVTLKHDDIDETRHFAVPIIVAPADVGPAPPPVTPKRAGLKPS